MINQTLQEKYENLIEYIRSLGKVAVAFSSGVDSTFLMYAAKEACGEDFFAITARAKSFPAREFEEAYDYCKMLGTKQYVLDFDPLQIEEFTKNPPNRCYVCKRALFEGILEIAREHGADAVMEGSNLDDLGDYRPGLQAIQELDIKSPLKEAGLTKQEIRDLSKEFGIPTWKKSSFACLASRFPYGEEITAEKLFMVDKGEQYLLDKGFEQFRVRIHQDVARIELLPEDFPRMLDEKLRQETYEKFKEIGFSYVSLDLKGYRTGSMNEKLNLSK